MSICKDEQSVQCLLDSDDREGPLTYCFRIRLNGVTLGKRLITGM